MCWRTSPFLFFSLNKQNFFSSLFEIKLDQKCQTSLMIATFF
jgi:hypothetical protein